MMKTISELFNNSNFQIPKYQRSYSWDDEQVRDLIVDLKEAVELNTAHYIGTIVMAKIPNSQNTYNIVDGQQRTTTLTIFLNELIKRLPDEQKIFNRMLYIKNGDYKLTPLHVDREFFHSMLEDQDVTPSSKSQRRLLRAKEIINESLATSNIDHMKFLSAINNLQVMQFTQNNDGDAIRIFQTVNDRGKSLTNMEKAKSLLVYYSNRFLNGHLDSKVNDCFGNIFENYDKIKELASELQITMLDNKSFNEDNIMRYHFIAFSDHDYDATPEIVLNYLKVKLKEKKDSNRNSLERFIDDYVTGLEKFFDDLSKLIELATSNIEYFKFFSILGLNTNLFPLATVLFGKDLLGRIAPTLDISLMRLLTIIDIRVYKIRGTDPRADISRFTYRVYDGQEDFDGIVRWLSWYLGTWMPDTEYKANLSGNVYERFRSILPFTFLEYNESLGNTFTLQQLKDIVLRSLTIEHILSQHPNFNPVSFGFIDEEEYSVIQHHLGNLALLEKSLNSQANKKNPIEKVAIYDTSVFHGTKQVGTQISVNHKFEKSDIDQRTQDLVAFLFQKYKI